MEYLKNGFTPRVTVALFLLLAGIWGTSFVAIEIGLHYFPPLSFAGLRYLIAGAIVLGYARVTTSYVLPRNRRDVLKIAVLAVFFIFGNHAFLYVGEQYVSGAIAAVVISLSPVLTAVFASLLLDDGHLSIREFVGFVAGIAGVVIIAQPGPGSVGGVSLLGLGLVFVAALSFALGAVLSHPIPTTIPLPSLQGWAMLGGASMLMIGGNVRGEVLGSIQLTPAAAWSFVYLTLVAGAFAFLLYFALLEEVGPAELNLVGYLEPVGATIVAWAVLGDIVDVTTVIGFVVIFAGFAIIKYETLARRFGVHLPSRHAFEKYV